MRFILIDGEICLATHFTLDEDVQTEQMGSSMMGSSHTFVTGRTISGEMLVFCQDSLPDFFRQAGKPQTVDVELVQAGTLDILSDVIFTAADFMTHSYDTCDAASVEYVATGIEQSTTKTISSTTAIN